MPNHASTALCHPTETRALSLKEYARIQGFPDEWAICGRTSEQYAQIGNAVPVRLGEIAGSVIAGELDKLEDSGWVKRDEAINGYRTIYIQAHVRTRQWYKSGETFVWPDGNANEDAVYGVAKTKKRVKQMIGK